MQSIGVSNPIRNEESVESNNISLTVTSAPTPSLTGVDPEGTTVGPAPTPSPKPSIPVKIKRKTR